MFSYGVNREFYVKFSLTHQAKIGVNIIYISTYRYMYTELRK